MGGARPPQRGWSRRWLLASLPAAAFAESKGRGHIFPSSIQRYPDPATEFPVLRLTDPAVSSFLPAYYARAISRRGSFLLYSSDRTGSLEAFRMEVKSGQSRQLTEADNLDPASLTLLPEDRGFCFLDGPALMQAGFASLRPREIYRIAGGYERGAGSGVTDDGLYAAVIERGDSTQRLRLVDMIKGGATTLVECDEELRDPIPRPRRASLLYRRGGGVWLVNFDGRQNYRLRLTPGGTGPAMWSPDGRSVLYLNFPEDRKKLNNLREFTPDTNEDQMIAATSQFVHFGRNADASVFVGACGSKASPHVLILVRTVKRELTLCEHRASNPRAVAPIFAPSSQRVYFQSDQHGKPALYSLMVDRLVAETESE